MLQLFSPHPLLWTMFSWLCSAQLLKEHSGVSILEGAGGDVGGEGGARGCGGWGRGGGLEPGSRGWRRSRRLTLEFQDLSRREDLLPAGVELDVWRARHRGRRDAPCPH